MRPQAPKGGCIGVNGEFYEGGKFLPSTEKPKRHGSRKLTGKQEIEPYVWSLPPAGYDSIYEALRGMVDVNFNLNNVAIDYYQEDASAVKSYADLYKSGWRWIAQESRLKHVETSTSEYLLLRNDFDL